MGKVNTSKKLELVRAIRLQNQYDRQLFRSREGILYSKGPGDFSGRREAELYGLESAEKYPVNAREMNGDQKMPAGSSFRLRFVIAMFLLLFFILCDINHLSYRGENTDSIYQRLTSSPDFSEVFEMFDEK